MKKYPSILNKIAVVTSLALGALALSAVAQVWNNPSQNPPNGNVPTPINVSGGGENGPSSLYSQIKTGLLTLNNLVAVNMNVASGTISTPGSILTNDGNGNAAWAMPGSSGFMNMAVFDYTTGSDSNGNTFSSANGTYSWTVPAGVKKVMVEVWGGGGGAGWVGGATSNDPANDGGAGGYSKGIFSVTTGTVLPISVGAAGSGDDSPFLPGASISGGSSAVANIITATGGIHGKSNPDGLGTGTGGHGSGGQFNLKGQDGQNSYFNNSSVSLDIPALSPGGGSSIGSGETYGINNATPGRVVIYW